MRGRDETSQSTRVLNAMIRATEPVERPVLETHRIGLVGGLGEENGQSGPPEMGLDEVWASAWCDLGVFHLEAG